MSRIFLKTIILSLSLLTIACQGEKKKGDFTTLDKPYIESYNNDRTDSPQKSNRKKKKQITVKDDSLDKIDKSMEELMEFYENKKPIPKLAREAKK